MIVSWGEAMIGERLAHRLFHPPRRAHHRGPADFGLTASETTIRTADGTALHVWMIPGTGVGTAVVGHGIGLTKSASLRQAALLHGRGYHVVLFDHRNHGMSDADPSRSGLADRFGSDIDACIALATRTWPGDGPLVLWGFSFSTFPTLHSLRHRHPRVAGALFDSGPGLDLDAMLRHFLTGDGISAPRTLRKVLRRRGVVDAFATSAVRMLGTSWPPPEAPAAESTPMLFLIGTEDAVIDPAQISAIASHYPTSSTVELPTGHLQGVKAAPEQYGTAVLAFLDGLDPAKARGGDPPPGRARTGQTTQRVPRPRSAGT